MEITEFLRRAGGRLWLLVVIPLLGAGAVVALSGDEKPTYQAIGTVVVTPPSGAEAAAAVAQAVDGFRSALSAQIVLDSASHATGVPVGEIRDDVSSRRIGASNIVEVTYAGSRQDKAAKLLTEQITQAQNILFTPALSTAKRGQAAAKSAYDKAADGMVDLRRKTGLILPTEDYRAAAAEVTQLRVALVQSDARLTRTGPIQEALAKAEKDLDALAGKVREFEDAQFAVDRARTDVTEADRAVTATQARLEAARSGDSLKVGAVVEQARTTPLVRSAVSAAVVGLVLAFLLLVLLELVRPRRRAELADQQPHLDPATRRGGPEDQRRADEDAKRLTGASTIRS
jgi:hypothetical protein